jgi:cell division septum initiation protein DivIVA
MEVTTRTVDLSDSRYIEIEKFNEFFQLTIWQRDGLEPDEVVAFLDMVTEDDLSRMVEILDSFIS